MNIIVVEYDPNWKNEYLKEEHAKRRFFKMISEQFSCWEYFCSKFKSKTDH